MDDRSEPAPEPARPALPAAARFVPDRRFTALAGVGIVVALIAFAVVGDPPSRLIAGIATVVLIGYVAGDVVFSPRLEASAAGLVVRSPSTRASLAWSEIDAVYADVQVRHGLRSTALEINAGEVLVVLSRRALGADPERAAEQIRALRPR